MSYTNKYLPGIELQTPQEVAAYIAAHPGDERARWWRVAPAPGNALGLTTDDIPEGIVNLYYNPSRVSKEIADAVASLEIPEASDDLPQPLGTAAAGVAAEYSRGDHVHGMPDASDVGAEPYAGVPAQTSFWRSTAAGVRAWVQLVVADITDLATTLANYLPKLNPTYTGRLTGPTQRLEADEQILLAIRRLGGVSGRIHGIAFMAQNDASAWVEFGRAMTYISSVAAGAHTGGMRLMAYKDGAIVQALDAGPDVVTFGGTLSGPRATLTEFGKFQELPGIPAYGALYGSNVTPGGFTYSLRIADDGSDAVLNGSANVVFAVAGGSKVAVTASEMNLASGVALKMSAITVIDSGRNIVGTSLKATGLAAATVRPATIGTDGLLGAQDPATFLGTIGAAPSSHTHPYLPISNPTFTGTLTGNDVKIGSASSAGWLELSTNNTGTGTFNIDFLGGASSNRRMTFRWSDSLDNLNIMTSNDDGSARLDRVLIPRSSALPIAVAGGFNVSSGDLSVRGVAIADSSRNITGATLKGGNLAGTGNRPLVAGADGTIDDQDAATFRGTIGAAPLAGAEILIHSDFGRSATTDVWQSAFTNNAASGLQFAANSIASGTKIVLESLCYIPADSGGIVEVCIGPQLTGEAAPTGSTYAIVLTPGTGAGEGYGNGMLRIEIELIGSGSAITGYVVASFQGSGQAAPVVATGSIKVDGTLARTLDLRFNPLDTTSYVFRRNRVFRRNP